MIYEGYQRALNAYVNEYQFALDSVRGTAALDNALYACSEYGIFGDLSIDVELACKIWCVVQRVKENGFPTELRA